MNENKSSITQASLTANMSATHSNDSHENEWVLFFGQASPAEARVYARLPRPLGWDKCVIRGTLQGPYCEFSQTLPATFAFRDLGPGKTLLAETVIPDPCFWSEELPFQYRVRLEVCFPPDFSPAPPQSSHIAERLFGIHPLGIHKNRLGREGKNWVLRGAWGIAESAEDFSAWRESRTALVVREPSEELCRQASRLGVLLIPLLNDSSTLDDLSRQVRRLGAWPAVSMVILPQCATDLHSLRPLAPNLLLVKMYTPDQLLNEDEPADLIILNIQNAEELHNCKIKTSQPVLIARRANSPFTTPEQGRAACDLLQRETAGLGDWAGYLLLDA